MYTQTQQQVWNPAPRLTARGLSATQIPAVDPGPRLSRRGLTATSLSALDPDSRPRPRKQSPFSTGRGAGEVRAKPTHLRPLECKYLCSAHRTKAYCCLPLQRFNPHSSSMAQLLKCDLQVTPHETNSCGCRAYAKTLLRKTHTETTHIRIHT